MTGSRHATNPATETGCILTKLRAKASGQAPQGAVLMKLVGRRSFLGLIPGAVLLGVAGSFLGSVVGERIGWYQSGDTAGFVMSAAGAVTLLAIFRFLAGTSKPSSRRDDSFDS